MKSASGEVIVTNRRKYQFAELMMIISCNICRVGRRWETSSIQHRDKE